MTTKKTPGFQYAHSAMLNDMFIHRCKSKLHNRPQISAVQKFLYTTEWLTDMWGRSRLPKKKVDWASVNIYKELKACHIGAPLQL